MAIEDRWVVVTIDVKKLEKQEKRFDEVLKLCEQQQFDRAESILKELIQGNPTHSKFYRVKGQIESETGRLEEAIDSLIDTLRWDPTNKWALIMMGNVFYKQRRDFETALQYFNKALEVDPEDYFAMNNIGINLLREDARINCRAAAQAP